MTPPQDKTLLGQGRFLRLFRVGHWEYAERINANGAVIILAITGENRVLLVEQYRIPLGRRTIELPAGISGDEPSTSNEALAEAARRELLEETGYAAGMIQLLMITPSSSGLASEVAALFLAKNLRRVGDGGGHAGEEITVHEVPLAQVAQWLDQKAHQGVLVDAKVYAGLYFAGREREAGI